MTTMLEQIARAIWDVGASDDIDMQSAKGYAHAALTALLSPTDGMVGAGFKVNDGPFETGPVFVSMIRAALEEK